VESSGLVIFDVDSTVVRLSSDSRSTAIRPHYHHSTTSPPGCCTA